MPDSYDIHFARMAIELGLAEKDKLGKALNKYQASGEAKGFARWLIDRNVLEQATVEKVASKLERWFMEQRAQDEPAVRPAPSKTPPAPPAPPPREAAAAKKAEQAKARYDDATLDPLVRIGGHQPRRTEITRPA